MTKNRKGNRWRLFVPLISILLVLGGILFWTFIWKPDEERGVCVMQIRNVEIAMRSYMSMNGYSPGEDVPGFSLDTLIEHDFIDSVPRCPSGGTYSRIEGAHPPVGVHMLRCSHPDHVP